MSPSTAYEITRQTLLILLPELLILLSATVMMTAGVFLRWPRRVWCGAAVGTLVAALIILFAVGGRPVDPYSAVALNDAFSHGGRLVILLSGLILLALAHDQVDDARAAELLFSPFAPPLYVTVIACFPFVSGPALKVAVPSWSVTEPRIFPPSLNTTVPVMGVPPGCMAATVAVSVTDPPIPTEVLEAARVVCVGTGRPGFVVVVVTVTLVVPEALGAKLGSPL
jgi:hypothetical protein